jgi:hypothetical protein
MTFVACARLAQAEEPSTLRSFFFISQRLGQHVRYQVDIWMTYHPDARSVSRVSFFIDWLRTIFDPKRYPWFGDEFIHPRDLAAAHAPKMTETLLNLPILKPSRRAGSG